MILIESQVPVPPIWIKYMNEEGIEVLARPILVLTCLSLILSKALVAEKTLQVSSWYAMVWTSESPTMSLPCQILYEQRFEGEIHCVICFEL